MNENEWFCDHCGTYFPALTFEDVCPCGAPVDKWEGVARMADNHRWLPDGNGGCLFCPANELTTTVRLT